MTAIDELKEIKLQDLKLKTPAELVSLAEELEVENASALRKQELLFAILKNLAVRDVEIIGEGAAAGPAHVTAEPDGVDRYRILVTAPAAAVVSGGSTIRFVLSDASGTSSVAAPFDGPES
jgi:transcription termination factor Rho